MTRAAQILGGALALCVLWLAWRLGGGPMGLAYLTGYVLATAPGWPVGWRLFGRRHAAGWIAGGLLGYAFTAWGIWAVTVAGLELPIERVVVWTVMTAAIWACLWRDRPPLVSLPDWASRDTVALLVMLWSVPVLTGPAFLKIGALDAEGNRCYRAYFTADVVWHVALVSEVKRFEPPLRNPYTADRELHYYWTYFYVPPAIASVAPRFFGDDPMPWVLINAIGAGLLFVGSLFVFTWCARPRAALTLTSVALVFFAASAEGTYLLQYLWRDGQPLSEIRNYNVDAVTRWVYDGLTVDNLPRSLWYTPQHAGACALGLIALMTLLAARGMVVAPALQRRGFLLTRLFAGLALAAAVTFSPLLGGMFALIYGLAAALQALMTDWRRAPVTITGHALAALPVVLAIGALAAAGMIEGAGDAMHIGFVGYARRYPVTTLVFVLGPVLIPALAALWPKRFPPMLAPAAVGLIAGIALFYLGSLPFRDPIWVGWRAGQIMLVSLPALLARVLAFGWDRWRVPTAIAATLIALVGLPTTALDAYNSQDIANIEMGAGFRWTVRLTPSQQEALRWIRQTTYPSAIVQPDIVSRGSDTWTLIPTFAQRRMYAGIPISLLYEEEYKARAELVRQAFATTNGEEAWHIFKEGRVQYVYVDTAEKRAYPPEAIAKFGADEAHFSRVFRNADVDVYLVR